MSEKLLTYVNPASLKKDYAAGQAFQKAVLSRLPLQGNTARILQHKRDRAEGMARRGSEMRVRDRLGALFGRSMVMCSDPARRAEAKKFFEDAIAAQDNQEGRKTVSDLVAAARGEGADANEAQATLQKIVVENVGKLIRFSGSWMQWYKSVTLKEDEVPFIRTFVPQEVQVRYGNADGTLTTHDVQPDIEDETKATLFFLLSDIIRAKLFDVNKGFIADSALAVVDVALDLMDKLDAYLQLPLLVGTPNSVYVPVFVTNDTPASHYHVSQRINKTNYPAGNIIAPASNGAGTKPRFDCLRVLDEYYSRFASALDGGVGPVRIHIASGIAHEFGLEFTPTSVANPYTDQLHEDQKVLNYNGRAFTIIPDDTLDPASKFLYANYGVPAGIFFEKPAGSASRRVEDEDLNEVQVWQRKLIATLYPTPWAIGSVAVQFKL